MARHRPHPQPHPTGAPPIHHPRTPKPRRAFGDPIAAPVANPRFVPPPDTNLQNLNLPLQAVMSITDIVAAKRLVFHIVGDTGGVHGKDTQDAIAGRMEDQYEAADAKNRPAFLYHLGDVVYYNGQSSDYPWQFYEPYVSYHPHIFAIPGNHDGDTLARRNDPAVTEPSLTGFVQHFCDDQPHDLDPHRATMTQPYVYWTLEAPLVTIIGLYSNVDGSLDGRGGHDQQQWFEDQLDAAPKDKCLLVAVHHAPYSLDRPYGGYPDIVASLERAMTNTHRVPDAVFSGHVHSYQRFTRTRDGAQIPYVVAGAGGYANTPRAMHKLQVDESGNVIKPPFQTNVEGVVLASYNDVDPGFMRVTIDGDKLVGEYFTVPFDGTAPAAPFDTFTLHWKTHKVT